MNPSKEDREYTKPEEAKIAREINDWLVFQGDEEAISRKIEGYTYGQHGYDQQWDKAREVIDYFVPKRSPSAIMHRIKGYTMGYTGYKHDYIEGHKFIETAIAEGNEDALFHKADSLFYGRNGYKKNVPFARELFSLIVQQGGKHSDFVATWRLGIPIEKEPLSKGHPDNKKLIVDQITSHLSSSAVKQINEMESHRNPLGYYLKALGMKYGLFGFEKNRERARIYILENLIPY